MTPAGRTFLRAQAQGVLACDLFTVGKILLKRRAPPEFFTEAMQD